MKKNKQKIEEKWKSVTIRGIFKEAIKNNRNKIKNRNTKARKWQKQNWHQQIIKTDRKDWGEGKMNGYIKGGDQSKEIKPKKQNQWIHYKEIENELEASVRNEGKKGRWQKWQIKRKKNNNKTMKRINENGWL